jgi:hypothetical protein
MYHIYGPRVYVVEWTRLELQIKGIFNIALSNGLIVGSGVLLWG